MVGSSWRLGAAAVLISAASAVAQGGPVGPCTPYRAADGDIASEMPGCARRLRPAPGSLDDEMAFRRARPGPVEAEDDEAPTRPRGGRHAPRR